MTAYTHQEAALILDSDVRIVNRICRMLGIGKLVWSSMMDSIREAMMEGR